MWFAALLVSRRMLRDFPESESLIGKQLVSLINKKLVETNYDGATYIPLILFGGKPTEFEKEIKLGQFFTDLPNEEGLFSG